MIILLVTFAVRVEEGVGPRLRRPHRLQPLGLHHPGEDNMVNKVIIKLVNRMVIRVIKVVINVTVSPLHIKPLPQRGLSHVDVVLLLGGKGKGVVRVGGVSGGETHPRT